METSLQQRERSSGYLPQDVFTEEQPSLRRQSVQCCIDLNKAEGKSKCWRRLKECEQSSRRVKHNNLGETFFQQAPNFANIHPRAKNYNPSRDVCPPAIPTSSFRCCRCCIHKQAVRCLGVKLFLSISAIIEWALL